MRDETWVRLTDDFKRFPILKGEPVPEEEIARAETDLGRPFPEDYRAFVKKYGGAMVGPYPVFGLRSVGPMGNRWSVIKVNEHFRKMRWPGIEGWLVISEDHAGNPMGFGPDGRVYVSDHGAVLEIATDFEGFLLGECLKL